MNQKQNKNKHKQSSPKPKLIHFSQLHTKTAISLKCLEQEVAKRENIASNHGNIDIILIPERPFFSLLLSNNPEGKCAQELACAI
jgi:hypothetical protein